MPIVDDDQRAEVAARFARDFKHIEGQMPALAARLRDIMRDRVARTQL